MHRIKFTAVELSLFILEDEIAPYFLLIYYVATLQLIMASIFIFSQSKVGFVMRARERLVTLLLLLMLPELNIRHKENIARW